MADAAAAEALDVDAVAFDLDGTLLDTIHDLAAAVNGLLAERGLAVLPKATIRDFVGKGMANSRRSSRATRRSTRRCWGARRSCFRTWWRALRASVPPASAWRS